MRFGLSEYTIDKIHAVFRKYPEVRQVIIYGSRAKGNFREGSDIDITMKGDNLTFSVLSRIQQDIDDLNTPYLFDISIYEQLDSTGLVEHINRVGKVFYLIEER